MSRAVIRRETAITAAFRTALAAKGIDSSDVRAPLKTEPTWTVTRRRKK